MNQESAARVPEEDPADEPAADESDSMVDAETDSAGAKSAPTDAATDNATEENSEAGAPVEASTEVAPAAAPAEKVRRDSASPILSPPVERTTALPTDIDMILDIPVNLSMEIGRTRLTIGELLSLGKGSIVELQRMTDEPMDVLVNGTLVAHGEAVVVGERFGIRLTDVISPSERLNKVA
jgi:flagellar motor switch protein FliN/FliY